MIASVSLKNKIWHRKYSVCRGNSEIQMKNLEGLKNLLKLANLECLTYKEEWFKHFFIKSTDQKTQVWYMFKKVIFVKNIKIDSTSETETYSEMNFVEYQ